MIYDLQKLAREFRQKPTAAEHLLWQHIRHKKILGCKFRRQYVFDRYIVDFVCFSHKLIIEADGMQHAENIEYDYVRTIFFNNLNFKVIRFWNQDILNNIDWVIK